MLTKKTLIQINERRSQKNRDLWQFMALGTGVIFLAALLLLTYPLALALLLAGVTCAWLVYRRDQAGQTISVVYKELDTETGARFATIQEACKALASSERIWHLAVQRDRTSKLNSCRASERQRVEVGRLDTPGISANVAIWGMGDEELMVFFFPEAILLYQQERYRAISYESLKVTLSSEQYPEEEVVPEDADVVGHTWRFTREDGSPDRRYTDNPKLPVVLYALLKITGAFGLDVRLQVSNRAAAKRFARAFGVKVREEPREKQPPKGSSRPEGQKEGDRRSEGRERANGSAQETKVEPPVEYEILGVTKGASMGEITAAYRSLARMYHPDKVENLGPEVREFAVNKMKEINVAYATLKLQNKQQSLLLDEGNPTKNGKEGAKRE